MLNFDIKGNGKEFLFLLHGFMENNTIWNDVERQLSSEFTIVKIDLPGHGKSDIPTEVQTMEIMAEKVKKVADDLAVQKFHLLGHSMGGMLATRFTLMYPERVEKLILENPIGLEDWKLVAPYASIDKNYQTELKADYESTKKYQNGFYYDNKWKPEYDEWVYLLTGWIKAPDYPKVALVNAKTSDMIFTQPVVYEFQNLNVPTLLIIGTRDRTAIGKANVKDPKIAETMGRYDLLGKATQQKIKGSKLVEIENVGHLPHIEVFDQFIKPVKEFLK